MHCHLMLTNGVTLNESACHLSVPPFVCLRVLMAAYKVCIHAECVFGILIVTGFPPESWKPIGISNDGHCMNVVPVDLFPPSGTQFP